ncbi:MAG: hypothetical protein WDZ76_05085 [Pseudohongiellaceae bacterium]
MRSPSLKLVCLAGLLFVGPPALSQDSSQADPRDNETAPPIEAITITGERTLLSMRIQIESAEELLYGMFNTLNSSDDFDIHCRHLRSVRSHLPRRVCEPVFFFSLRKDNSQQALMDIRQAYTSEGIDPVMLSSGMALLDSDSELRSLAEGRFTEMNEEILKLAMENPAYLEALLRVNNLKTEYEAERKARFRTRETDSD